VLREGFTVCIADVVFEPLEWKGTANLAFACSFLDWLLGVGWGFEGGEFGGMG
jgi:hypothetical protein